VLAVAGLGNAGAVTGLTTLTCGQTVTTSVKLAADLNCQSDNSDAALLDVTGSNVTLNLNGHSIVGGPGNNLYAIEDGAGGATIENGHITGTSTGIYLNAVTGSTVGNVSFALSTGSTAVDAEHGSGNTLTKLSGTDLNQLASLVDESGDTVSSSVSHGAVTPFHDHEGTNDTFSGDQSYSAVGGDFLCEFCSGDTFSHDDANSYQLGISAFRDTSATGEDTYDSNTVALSGGDGFDLSTGEPSIVENNVVLGAHYGISGFEVYSSGPPVVGSTITGNVISGTTSQGILLTEPVSATISGNTVTGAGLTGIDVEGPGVDAVTFTGNIAKNNGGSGILFLSGGGLSAQPAFANNTATGNGSNGIVVSSDLVAGTGNVGRSNAGAPDCINLVCAAPANTTAPSISYTSLAVGQTLTGARGAWTISTIQQSYAYQWLRCDSSGASCAAISGATALKHTIVNADRNSKLEFQVSAHDDNGTTQVASSPVFVSPPGPVNTALPTITGTVTDGKTLTAHNGSWSSLYAGTFGYQWYSCTTADNSTCTAVGTSSTYTLTPQDFGNYIRVDVTATNAGDSTTASSAYTAQVAGAPPRFTSAPTMRGTSIMTAGYTVIAMLGNYAADGTPTFSYQWLHDGSSIHGATGSTYVLGNADVGKHISVKVTITTAYGSSSSTSAQTTLAVGAGQPPFALGAPVIVGSALGGATLSITLGIWKSGPPIVFTYQWERCDDTGANCSPVGGQTGATYALTPADEGSSIAVVVTGTNTYGQLALTSAATGVVAADPPQNTVLPSISLSGGNFNGSIGTWTGAGITYQYQWLQCDNGGNNCSAIGGATTTSIPNSHLSGTVRFQVTATNVDGQQTATSNAKPAGA
jgi:Right handed beta helix region